MTATSLQEQYLAAHGHATRLSLPKVVGRLIEVLGPKVVAYIGGVEEARAAQAWAEGTREVKSDLTAQRLRIALHTALFLGSFDSADVVRAWFTGLNPELDDRSPARVLRDGRPDEVGPEVLSAARAFAAGG